MRARCPPAWSAVLQRRVRRRLRHDLRALGRRLQPAELKERLPTTCASSCCACRHVNKVEIFGAQDEKVFVEIPQKRLAQLGSTFNQVLAQIGQQNAVEAPGTMQRADRLPAVRVAGQFNTGRGARALPDPRPATSFRLGDIAEIRRGYVGPAAGGAPPGPAR